MGYSDAVLAGGDVVCEVDRQVRRGSAMEIAADGAICVCRFDALPAFAPGSVQGRRHVSQEDATGLIALWPDAFEGSLRLGRR